MKILIILISVLFWGFYSCEVLTEPSDFSTESNVPYGIWVYSGSFEDVLVYHSAAQFADNRPGIAFRWNNVFIERTSGWCGTPPLHFYNVKGEWMILDDNNFIISCSGCLEDERILEVVYLSTTELKIRSWPGRE